MDGPSFREGLSKRFLTRGFNGVGGHSWELGPVPIPNTEVNLPGDPCGSVVRDPTRSLDRCQPHLKILERSRNFGCSEFSIFKVMIRKSIVINLYNAQRTINLQRSG